MSAYPPLSMFNGQPLTDNFNPNTIYVPTYTVSNISAGSVNAGSVVTSAAVLTDDIIDVSNNASLATVGFVNSSIASLINNADSGYQTLQQIEVFLQNDDNLISALTSTVNTKANSSTVTDLSTNVYSRLTADEAAISTLQGKTNGISYNSSTNTTTLNSKLVVALDDQLNGNTTIGDSGTDTLTVNAAAVFNGGISGLTKSSVGLGNVDNTSDVNKPLSNAQKTYIDTADALKANVTDLSATNVRVTSLEGKTSALSYNAGTNTTSINSKLSVALDISSNGNTVLGDAITDLLTVNAATTFNGTVSGLTKSTVGLGNVDNTSDVNKPLSNAQKTYVDNGLATKANLTQTLYQNTSYVNAGVNLLSTVLTSIGTNQGQTIIISSGTVNDTSGVSITVPNLTIQGPDSAFASASTVVNGTVTISGSSNTRCRISNLQFTNDMIIDGTLGRHNFKGCTFNGNFTVQGSMTNWINCYYCTFSGQVNIPNTFAGYIIFYFCDFSGATLNFNNVSNQQVYLNSCVNLPSLTVNGLLTGFNTSTTSSAVNTVTFNCTGATTFANNSISSASINNTSFVDLSTNQTVSGTKTINALKSATQSQGNNSTNVATTAYVDTGLATKQNTLVYDSVPTTSSTNVVNSGNIKSYVDSSIANLVASAPSALDTLNELASALGNDPNYATSTATLIGTKLNASNPTFTGTLTGNSIVDNGSFSASGNVTLGTNTSNTTTINSNISANSQTITPTQLGYLSGATSNIQTQLNSKANTANPSFTGTLTAQSITDNGAFSASGNVSLGSSTTNTITVNGNISANSQTITPTQLGYVAGATSNLQTQISNKASDAAVVHLTGAESIAGQKTFSTGITLNGSDLNTRLTTDESNISSLQSGKQNTLVYDSVPTASSSNSLTSGSIYTSLQNYQPTSGMSSYLTTSTAASTYQTQSGMSSYAPINNTTLTGQTTVNEIIENIYGAGSGTSLSLAFTSINGIVYYSPSANYTLSLTSVPTSNTNCSVSVTLVYNTKFYANAININGTARTIYSGNGTSNLSVNSSATYVIQQFNILFLNSSTPVVFCNLLSMF